MKFDDRKEFLYESDVFKRYDTKTALQIREEYVKRHSAIPAPKFFEVDRRQANIDELWHQPVDERTIFSRTIEIPAINRSVKPQWNLTRLGIVPVQRDTFELANNTLQQVDYFPMRGDLVYWNGYRFLIERVTMARQAYWMQTNVWLALLVECVIPPVGDAKPLPNMGVATPSEAAVDHAAVVAAPIAPYTPHHDGKQGL